MKGWNAVIGLVSDYCPLRGRNADIVFITSSWKVTSTMAAKNFHRIFKEWGAQSLKNTLIPASLSLYCPASGIFPYGRDLR
jgi:hypothetical protein